LFLLSLPLRNLGRRLLRSSLTALGVTVAVATLIALVGISHGVERTWTQSITDRGIHMICVRKSAVDIMTSTIDQVLVKKIREMKGVKAASGELFDLVKLEPGVVAVGGWPLDSFLWQTLHLRQGRLPGPKDHHGVVMGQKLAERLELGLGDTFSFLGSEVEILGISQQTSVLNQSTLVLPLPLMQKKMGKKGKVTLINLRLDHPDAAREVDRLQARLQKLYPDLTFLETKEVTDSNQLLRLLRKMNWSVSIVALLMGLFFILNTMLMAVTERTREVGILVALGWSKGRILVLVMLEGLLLAALGSALGLGVGLAGLKWLASLKHVQGFIDPVVSPRFLLEVFLAATMLGVTGSFYPAWRAARLRAVESLKYE
jgi:putative ABC transport system permease protein